MLNTDCLLYPESRRSVQRAFMTKNALGWQALFLQSNNHAGTVSPTC